MEDGEIIGLFFARDQRALTASSEKYGRRCLAVARNILGSDQDGEECFNDALLRAWNAIPPEKPALLGAYLARITRNLALSRWRREHAEKRGGGTLTTAFEELEDCVAGRGDAASALDAAELTAALDEFLAGLPREQRRMFLRRYWYAEPLEAIARETGRSTGAVVKAMSRIRAKLRNYLTERGFLDP